MYAQFITYILEIMKHYSGLAKLISFSMYLITFHKLCAVRHVVMLYISVFAVFPPVFIVADFV